MRAPTANAYRHPGENLSGRVEGYHDDRHHQERHPTRQCVGVS
jgi:hypothetical protein